MIKEKLDSLIADAMKAGEKYKLKVLRLIKSEYQVFETSKDNKGNMNVLDDATEVKILKKMLMQWEEEAENLYKAGRDMTDIIVETNYLKSLIPEEPSYEEQEAVAKQVIECYLLGLPIEDRKSMKHLGPIMKIIKEQYPNVNGKLVSSVYKEMIGLNN